MLYSRTSISSKTKSYSTWDVGQIAHGPTWVININFSCGHLLSEPNPTNVILNPPCQSWDVVLFALQLLYTANLTISTCLCESPPYALSTPAPNHKQSHMVIDSFQQVRHCVCLFFVSRLSHTPGTEGAMSPCKPHFSTTSSLCHRRSHSHSPSLGSPSHQCPHCPRAK